jgi:hypothetical protein
MSKVTINGVDLELDLMDADVVEKFEDLNKWIVKKIQDPNAYEGLSTADGMRFQCTCVNEYFDKLFGAGTAEKVFHKNNNLGIRMEGFAQVTALSGESKTFMDDLSAKYGSGRVQNRQQRRAEQRKGGKNKHQNRNNFNAVNNG